MKKKTHVKRKRFGRNISKRRNNRNNKTRKGGWSFFGFDAPPNPTPNSPNPIPNSPNPTQISQTTPTNSLYELAKGKTTSEGKIMQGTSLATNLAYGSVAVLAATGVGIPLAGAITGVLIIAKTIANKQMYHDKLLSVLLDVLNIITHCNKLNLTIVDILKIFNGYGNKDKLKPLQIDNEINERLKEKMLQLIEYLLDLSSTEALQILRSDPNLKENALIYNVIKKECTKRGLDVDTGKSTSNGYSLDSVAIKFNDGKRYAKRKVKAEFIISEIVRELTIITGYFMLMKSQFDMLIQQRERHITDEIKKKIWEEIESTQGLYSSYLSLDMTAVTESIENSKTTEVDSEEVVIEVVN